MTDPILEMFGWLTPLVARMDVNDPRLDAVEQQIITNFSEGWGKTETSVLLRKLTQKYDDLAGITIEKVLSAFIAEDWAKMGASNAHDGTEIDDFIKVLWVPLQAEGFVYTSEKQGGKVVFNVTECPVYKLAKSTGLHQWLYHLACATDLTSTCAFSPAIRFERTKTLMEGSDHCDHTYIRIADEH